MSRYYYIKQMIDVTLSIFALLVIWPVFLVISAAIRFESGGPVFFKQERLGQGGKTFCIYKFRTMVDGAINMGSGLFINEGDSRITRVGNFLRKTSLDELPQLLNIIKGDMSIIGPRPPVPFYPRKYEEYDNDQKKRFLVKPGITGYAQVKVRNNATWDERIAFDVQYVENMNFKFDLHIFFKTIVTVLKKENIYFHKDAKDIEKISFH